MAIGRINQARNQAAQRSQDAKDRLVVVLAESNASIARARVDAEAQSELLRTAEEVYERYMLNLEDRRNVMDVEQVEANAAEAALELLDAKCDHADVHHDLAMTERDAYNSNLDALGAVGESLDALLELEDSNVEKARIVSELENIRAEFDRHLDLLTASEEVELDKLAAFNTLEFERNNVRSEVMHYRMMGF